MVLLGSHVSMSAPHSVLGSVKEAISYNANTFMIYTGAPQNTRRRAIDTLKIDEAKTLMAEHGLDMKDTVIHALHTVSLDPSNTNKVVSIEDIRTVFINGRELGLGGYLDIGLYDTMKDLFVNFIGAVVFAVIGFFYVKERDTKVGSLAKKFILQVECNDDGKSN